MQLAVVNAIWIGPRLGPVHSACLQSFIDHGHRVILHAYEAIEDAPPTVESFEARNLMSADMIVRHQKTGSLALASDIYRYRILRAGMGLYVDCDMFCMRPIADRDYILGWANEKHITSAVLKAPKDSALVAALCAAADDPAFVPPWDPAPKRFYHHLRKSLGMPVPVLRQRWGTIGPKLVTHSVQELGLSSVVSPPAVFSPLRSMEHHRLYEAGLSLAALATPETLAIHLRNELIRRRPMADIPTNSPMAQILAVGLAEASLASAV
jgi:hypothetical protein